MSSVLPRGDGRMAMRRAEAFLKEEGFTTLPINPRAIAEKLEISVQAKPDVAPGVSGMLLRHGNNFGILYATHIPSEGFQNFSIAHELGHYLIEGHPVHVFRDGTGVHSSHAGFVSGDPYEVEADHFAAGLLMPDPMFTSALHGAKDGLEGIEALTMLCGTSLTATAIRYAQTTSAPAAVVMSAGKRIEYCFMSKAMQEFADLTWPRKGESLPEGVETERFNRDLRNVAEARRDKTDVDLRRWFGGERRVEATEEIIGLGRYGKTLTVITTSTLVDDEDEEKDLEEQWTPRFRR